MKDKRFSIRSRAGDQEVAQADTTEDADMAVATLVERLGGLRDAFEIVDRLETFRQAKVVTSAGDVFTVYVVQDGEGSFIAVDNPFAKEVDQIGFALDEGGVVYEHDETADTYTRPLGTWLPLWQYRPLRAVGGMLEGQ